MKNLTNGELELWAEGGNISSEKIYFVIIKTQSCPKCMALSNKLDMFGNLKDTVASYTYMPSGALTAAAAILTRLEITSVPAIIMRYQKEGQWKLGCITFDGTDSDYTDLKCILDAIIDNDQRYFGYDDNDEPVDDDANSGFNRLLHLIHGENDPEKIREHRLLKNEIKN